MSDDRITIYTEWFDHDGRPLPEGLGVDHGEQYGLTGRLAKIVSPNFVQAVSNSDLSNFPIAAGRNMQVLQIRSNLTVPEHFYIHVSGAAKDENLMSFIRKLKLIWIPFFICVTPSISFAQNKAVNLQIGVTRNAIHPNLKAAMWNAPDGPHIAEAVVESETTGIYYWLFRASSIGLFDLNQSKNLSGWSLITFDDNDLEPEISKLYAEYQIEPSARTAENLLPILGCLSQNPLRYGDINQDGSVELAIFAQDEYGALNANIFSVASKKVIFSIRLATYDAVVNDRLSLADGEEEVASDPLANKPTDGQFLSRIAEENTRMVKGIRPAAINLSKLYFDDFDNDDVVDIVSWRKLYKTRLNQDPVKGFELDRSLLIHYKLIDGEYKKQPTEPSVVQDWLNAKNLTWQKGYPSKSECPGQIDQLIPEIHDPLLNDPDVLR